MIEVNAKLQRIAEMLAAGLTTRDVAESLGADERAIRAVLWRRGLDRIDRSYERLEKRLDRLIDQLPHRPEARAGHVADKRTERLSKGTKP